VARAGHQHRGGGAVFGVVGQRRVPQLVKRCPAAGLFEQCLGVGVGQAGAAAAPVEVAGWQLDPGPAGGEEQRAGCAAGD
jgi:hypothetical protein